MDPRLALALVVTVALALWPSSDQDAVEVAVLIISMPLVVAMSYVRLLVLTFGGLLAFQSSSDLGLFKIVYLAVAFASLLISVAGLVTTRDRRLTSLMEPLILAGILFAGVVAMSLLVAVSYGTLLTDWLRDAAPYLLFSMAPVFASDFSSTVSRRSLRTTLIAAGTLAALSFAVEWAGANRRQLLELPINHLVLPSAFLSIALVCFSSSSAVLAAGHDRIRWIAFTSLLVAVLVMLTGTRSFLVLLIVPLIASISAPGNVAIRSLAVAGATVAALCAAFVITLLVLQLTASGSAALADRFASVSQLLVDAAQDASYVQRTEQLSSAADQFGSSPLVGTGPGHLFYWPGATGRELTTFNVDTGMSMLAKFGLIGLAAMLIFSLSLFRVLRRLAVAVRSDPAWLALVSYSIVTVIWFALGSPLEDKGLSIGLILLLAMALSAYRDAGPQRLERAGILNR